MLTVGEHDSMWKDVMGRQIPDGVNEIKNLRLTIRNNMLINGFKEIYEHGGMDEVTYIKNIMTCMNGVMHSDEKLWTKEEIEDVKLKD